MMTIQRMCLSVLAIVLLANSSKVDAAEITVEAGAHDRNGTLIAVPIDQVKTGTNYQVRDIESAATADCQWGAGALWFILPEPMSAGTSRTFRLEPAAGPLKQAAQCKAQADAVQFLLGEQLVAEYLTAVQEPPQGVDSAYRRSGFIHPVRTPQGRVLTDPFPVDHLHQHALFSAWTKCEFQGHPVDFWNQKKRQGTVEHRQVQQTQLDTGTFELTYVDLSQPKQPVDVLREEWQVRLFPDPQRHLFEITSTQTCVTESPLMVKEYTYGGMAYRGSDQWMDKQARFLTSEGKTREDGNHTRPHWVCMYGIVDGAPCGIAIFSHPDNFRSPQPVRLHPSMPYFVFSPPVLGDFEIGPNDKPLRNRYLYYAFDGEPDQRVLNSLWNDYASPPAVVSSSNEN